MPVPYVESPADANRPVYLRQPVLESGVAQVFTNPFNRSESLAHRQEGHYYGRASQPTLEHFERQFTSVMEAKHAYFTESGLAAALVAFKGLVPKNGTILYDRLIYYEIERGLMYLANQLDWRLMKADFTQLLPSLHLNILRLMNGIELAYAEKILQKFLSQMIW